MSQNIVFVGAGGAGVSSLVLLFQELSIPHIVAIDSNESELTKKLQTAGVKVIIGHGTYKVQQDDIIIYSDAAAESPEVLAAHEKVTNNHKRIFPPMTYFQFLGEISKYMKTIAVAGTHGKSTTTALTATALAKHHPQFGLGIVGAPINQRGHRNFIIGDQHKEDIKAIIQHVLFPRSPDIAPIIKKYLFVIEADEYNHHFLHLDTDYAIITNSELDHADVYGTFENYLDTFIQFGNKVRNSIFVLPDEPGIDSFLQSNNKPTDGPPVKGVSLPEWNEGELGGFGNTYTNKIIIAEKYSFPFTHLLGAHNHANASLALSCSHHLCELTDGLPDTRGIPIKSEERAPWGEGVDSSERSEDLSGGLQTTIETFQGLRRRGELLGKNKHGVPIITDYGHHPTELSSTLQALREKYPDQNITCIFQPHQARRVMEFWDAFTTTLQDFDTTLIYDIYAARENLEDLKQQFQTSKKCRHCEQNEVGAWQSPDFSNIASINDLGNLFATASGGTYTTNFNDIKNTLDETKEGVIVIFTAGNLDWEARKYLSSQK